MSHAHTRAQNDPLSTGRPVLVEVMTDLLVRREHGSKKYGTELKAENGRNPLLDLYQELLDGVMYAKQELMEQELRKPVFTPRELEIMRRSTIFAEQHFHPDWHEELKALRQRLGDLVAGAVAPSAESR